MGGYRNYLTTGDQIRATIGNHSSSFLVTIVKKTDMCNEKGLHQVSLYLALVLALVEGQFGIEGARARATKSSNTAISSFFAMKGQMLHCLHQEDQEGFG